MQIDPGQYQEALTRNYKAMLSERDERIVSLKSQLDVVLRMLAEAQRKLLEQAPDEEGQEKPTPAKNGKAGQREGVVK